MLTVLDIRNAKPGMHGDGNGLYLRVQENLSKGWIFRFQMNGKRREMGLGLLNNVNPQEARAAAVRLSKLVRDGIDPIEKRRKEKADGARAAPARLSKLVRDGVDPIEKRRQEKVDGASANARPAFAFATVAMEYIESHRAGWKNPKHAQQWQNTLQQYAFPLIGSKSVDEINTEDVLLVLKPIWAEKTETATRLRSRIQLVLGDAKAKGLRTDVNPAIWRGHLDSLLPNPTKLKAKTSRHHPALPYQRMPEFIGELKKVGGVSARAVEFAILTTARSQEVRLMTWSEVDLREKLWVVPASHKKAGTEHPVPLSKAAVSILKAMPKGVETDLVFPGTRRQPLSDMSLTAVLRRMDRRDAESDGWKDPAGDTITMDGFRSSFRNWSGEATNHATEIAEHALAHPLKDKAKAAYATGTLLDKHRRLLEDWAQWCEHGAGQL